MPIHLAYNNNGLGIIALCIVYLSFHMRHVMLTKDTAHRNVILHFSGSLPSQQNLLFSVESYYTLQRRPKGATSSRWGDNDHKDDDNDEDDYSLHP